MWNIDEFLSGLNIDLDRLRDVFTYDPQAPMIFSSGIFLWLFVAFILVYLLLQRRTTARLLFVTLFSYYFYYKSSGTYFFLLGLVTVCDFFIARLMAREAIPWLRKAWVVLSLFINLGLLCYFKYTNFLGETFASLTGGTFTTMDIFLPVGISFFTFQSLSYTIDVYRRQITPLTSLLDYAFYVSFFPQLVAGPIVRARDFIPQIRRPLFVSREMFGRGIFLIVSGLFKKAVISDYISVNFVERIFDNPTLYSGVENLMGVYGYALQIYCDFSGYSDMAIGIALLLGFHFNINFDSPYKSASITEFWRRWHISLSSWLRDYLYISLGGNRKGKIRQYANLIITMTKAVACGNRIQSVFAMQSSQTSGSRHPEETLRGQVEFRNAGITYGVAGAEALSSVSFLARPGQTVGIIGGTGSGKSTLVNLIPRFYDATQGQVLVDGVDVRELNLEELRRRIAVVPQKAVLFRGTIRSNLLWGREDATEEELQAALTVAQAMEIVQGKDQGLDAEVQQGGGNLSGGQRQRLTIARALIRQPEILILDDSASALDYATDARLRAAIGALPNPPTTFVVSQRAASIRHADWILVLDDGRVVGQGTHETLLEQCPVYQEIYHSQFRKEAHSHVS